MKKFVDLMPDEVLNLDEVAKVVGGNNPLKPRYGCESYACPASSADSACSGCATCQSMAYAPSQA